MKEEQGLCSTNEAILKSEEEAVSQKQSATQEEKKSPSLIKGIVRFPAWLCKTAYLALSFPLASMFVFISTIFFLEGTTALNFKEWFVQFAAEAELADYNTTFMTFIVLFCSIAIFPVLYMVVTSTLFRSIKNVCDHKINIATQKCGKAIDLTLNKIFKKYTKIFYAITALTFIGLFGYGVLYWGPNQAKNRAPMPIQGLLEEKPRLINAAAIVINSEVINGKAQIEVLGDGKYLVKFENNPQESDALDSVPVEDEADFEQNEDINKQSEIKPADEESKTEINRQAEVNKEVNKDQTSELEVKQ